MQPNLHFKTKFIIYAHTKFKSDSAKKIWGLFKDQNWTIIIIINHKPVCSVCVWTLTCMVWRNCLLNARVLLNKTTLEHLKLPLITYYEGVCFKQPTSVTHSPHLYTWYMTEWKKTKTQLNCARFIHYFRSTIWL